VGVELPPEKFTNREHGVAHLIDLQGIIVFKCVFLIFRWSSHLGGRWNVPGRRPVWNTYEFQKWARSEDVAIHNKLKFMYFYRNTALPSLW